MNMAHALANSNLHGNVRSDHGLRVGLYQGLPECTYIPYFGYIQLWELNEGIKCHFGHVFLSCLL